MTKPQKQRVDKLKNKAKVIAKVIAKPLATQREIAKELGMSTSTVNEHIQEIVQNTNKSQAIEKIIENDTNIVKLGQEILLERMKTPDKVSTRDIISATDLGARRMSLFKGQATDENGGLKEIKNITINVIGNGSTV